MSLYVPDEGRNHFLVLTTDDVTKFQVNSRKILKWSSFSLTNIFTLKPILDYWYRAFVTTEKTYEKHKDLFEHLKDMDKNVYILNKEQKINKWIKDKQKTTFIKISPDYKRCKFKYEGWIR